MCIKALSFHFKVLIIYFRERKWRGAEGTGERESEADFALNTEPKAGLNFMSASHDLIRNQESDVRPSHPVPLP